jgi:hypothetical protein
VKQISVFAVTVSFTNCLYSLLVQTVAGLTATQAQAPTFTKALSRTISACIGLLATVSGVTVVSSQRRLLSVVTINYSIGVVSTFPANTILAKFKTAVDNGIFLSYLKQSSGVGILSVSGLVTTDISPSSTPTGAPIGSSSASSSTGSGVLCLYVYTVHSVCIHLSVTCTTRNNSLHVIFSFILTPPLTCTHQTNPTIHDVLWCVRIIRTGMSLTDQ